MMKPFASMVICPLKISVFGDVADGDENARAIQNAFRAGLEIFQFHAGHLVLLHVQNFRHGGIPDRLDFWMGQRAFGHDFRGAQANRGDEPENDRAEAREIKRLFAGGIAAAHHHERLVAEHRQRAVARRAISHALGFQQILARHAEMLVARAGGDDDGFRLNFSPSTVSANGRLEKSTASTVPKLARAPKRSACFCIRVINS
jgi:hypothetical protein